jgi:glycosyltransferase involved in cell wall biosynthesis
MRVRIVTTNTFPDGGAATSRIHCYARALTEQGISVEVVAPTNSSRLDGEQYLFQTKCNGISTTLVRNTRSPRSIWLKRALAYIDPLLVTFQTIFTMRHADVFVLYFNTVFTRWLMLILLKIARKRTVIELNEYPYSHDGGKLTEVGFFNALFLNFTLRCTFPLANGFLTISESLSNLVAHYAPKARVLKLPALLLDRPIADAPIPRTAEGLYILHAGSLSERKDGITTLFDAFGLAHSRLRSQFSVSLRLLITNSAAIPKTREKINEIIARYDLKDHVSLIGYCDKERLEELMRGSIALVINKPSNLQNACNFPTKLPQYLASGRPVIVAARDMELNRFIIDKFNAILVAPNDSEAIARAIEFCFRNPEAATVIGRQALQTSASQFHYTSHAADLARFLSSV